MPKAMEEALRRRAKELGLTGERKNAFIYGTMQKKTDWKPKRKKKGKK
jgi:hypothetical protein